jgi:hypothetical protein
MSDYEGSPFRCQVKNENILTLFLVNIFTYYTLTSAKSSDMISLMHSRCQFMTVLVNNCHVSKTV